MESDDGQAGAHAFRVRFPGDEPGEPWLPLLLDAYAVLDAGLARAVAATDRRPACHPGCFSCCLQPIPASSLEVLGLTWYAIRHCRGGTQRLLRRNLAARPNPPACPFLVEGGCAAYVMRPMACREFLMLGAPCRPGERPERTRPGDLLPLPTQTQDRAFWHMLPYYGITEPDRRRAALENRLVLRDTGLLQARDWSWLAKIMSRAR
jgi:hypothetical protein